MSALVHRRICVEKRSCFIGLPINSIHAQVFHGREVERNGTVYIDHVLPIISHIFSPGGTWIVSQHVATLIASHGSFELRPVSFGKLVTLLPRSEYDRWCETDPRRGINELYEGEPAITSVNNCGKYFELIGPNPWHLVGKYPGPITRVTLDDPYEQGDIEIPYAIKELEDQSILYLGCKYLIKNDLFDKISIYIDSMYYRVSEVCY